MSGWIDQDTAVRLYNSGNGDMIQYMHGELTQPVIFAEWIEIGHTNKGTPIHQCSNCKVAKAGKAKSTYCPDCGAKMCSGILADQLRIPEV